ncbi:MAG: glycosyltransferase, partial [Actinobacteria bacterium]|nr:glycosyltransferase [Actinomycetota bacterium]
MPATQTIAVNLLSVVPGRVGGAEEYAVRVLSAYAQHGPADIRPVLYVLDGFQEAHPELARSFETEVCPVNGYSRGRRVLAESTWLARRATGAVHHFGGRLPWRTGRPTAVTIHDLQPLDHPERFSTTKAAYLSWALPRSIRRADVVVGVSDRVTQRLSEGFPIDPQKIVTVSSGVPEVAEQPAVSTGPPTILYPAATYPHKNHLVLIDAFNQLAERHPEVRLVLTG